MTGKTRKGGKTGTKSRKENGKYPVVAALAVAAALMLPHIGDAYGGFHGFNEAHYAMLGRSVMKDPLSYPRQPNGQPDFNIPPLTSYLLGGMFILFGASESSARLVPIGFSLLSTYVIYLIGRKLYGARTGLAAAFILAVTPMEVLVGRNVQADALLLAFGLLAVYLFICGRKVAAGFALGLSFLAKQPAVLFFAGLLILELWQKRRLDKGFALFTVAFILTLSPYVIYNLATNAGGFFDGQVSRAMLSVSDEGARHGLDMVGNETYWGLSPPISLCFALGFAYLACLRRREDSIPMVFAAVFIVFFVFYNKHSYYILPLAPFAALIAARAIMLVDKSKIAIAAVLILVVSGAFYSIILLCADKYGFEGFKRLPTLYAGDPQPNILITDIVSGSYIEVFDYYNPNAHVTDLSRIQPQSGGIVPLDYSKPYYMMYYWPEINPEKAPEDVRAALEANNAKDDKYALVLFGTAYYEKPLNPHFFTNTPWQMASGLPATSFGIMNLAQPPEIYLLKMKPGEVVVKNQRGGYVIQAAK